MLTHPDLVPGTILYAVRLPSIEGDDVHVERYEVLGARAGASWMFVLRQLPDAGTDSAEFEVLVQTNGHRIYDSTGNYYAATPIPPLDAHIARTKDRLADLDRRQRSTTALLEALTLVRARAGTQE